AWKDDDLFGYLSIGHDMVHGTAAGPMGEAVDGGLRHLAPEDIRALIVYLRSVPPESSPGEANLASAAAPSHRAGPAGNSRGKEIFEGACVNCHDWTGISPVTPYATLTGAQAVNDASAVNVVQAVIGGVKRRTPDGGEEVMPAFGSYSNAEIA